jgi:hypothetical protein
LNQTEFHALVLCLLDEVGNLGSSVSRKAISTLSDLCEANKKLLDPEVNTVVNSLMKKAGDGNTFIHEAIDKCLAAMCQYCTISKMMTALLHHSDSKNQLVRQKVAACFSSMIEKTVLWNADLKKLITLGL